MTTEARSGGASQPLTWVLRADDSVLCGAIDADDHELVRKILSGIVHAGEHDGRYRIASMLFGDSATFRLPSPVFRQPARFVTKRRMQSVGGSTCRVGFPISRSADLLQEQCITTLLNLLRAHDDR